MLTVFTSEFPDHITIGASARSLALVKYPHLMGDYKLDDTKAAHLTPVYKKTDGDYYIFYSSTFLLFCLCWGQDVYHFRNWALVGWLEIELD